VCINLLFKERMVLDEKDLLQEFISLPEINDSNGSTIGNAFPWNN